MVLLEIITLLLIVAQLSPALCFTFGAADTNAQQNYPSPESRQLIQGTVPSLVGTVTTCVCVPPGSCVTQPNPSGNTDGSGQIDIRIVNNVNPQAPQPYQSTTTPVTCLYGLVQCCTPGPYQCGRRYPPPPGSPANAVGQAAFGAYPWQAAILTTGDVYLGSGALIDRRHILTAAHKVLNLPTTSYKVRLGEWDAASTRETIPAEDITILSVYIHPNFNKDNLQNDVAILRLSTLVNLGQKSTIGTVCLPTTSFVGMRCYVAGWGKNDFGPSGAYQAIQREVDVPLVTNAACQTALRNTRLGANFILNDASFICAGGENGKDACTGDGGSPLVCQNNGIWYVVGMVAWGIGCATAGIPGVYVNVATYLPWIQTTILTP
ncbi:phenoloxidase-activating factor 2 isoform X1 [Episyrphus balteatus]|uniref:phenoloxidase-activating factor 2 isoform X1 n=1 Tax=Episyrphus balteatus TaxID=286459 RepID=UPI0024860666|nr:phenoloxidase-activating factor 2 isoform X1 [Episyrphus balteatus]